MGQISGLLCFPSFLREHLLGADHVLVIGLSHSWNSLPWAWELHVLAERDTGVARYLAMGKVRESWVKMSGVFSTWY